MGKEGGAGLASSFVPPPVCRSTHTLVQDQLVHLHCSVGIFWAKGGKVDF